MKYLILLMALTGCYSETPDSPELIQAKAEEAARHKAGAKYGSGCYKVIKKGHKQYGCTFESQGSMFLTDGSGPEFRDRSAKRNALTDPASWKLIFNRRIKCRYEGGYFIDETDVKPIKCPEYLYCDLPKNGKCPE